MVSPRLPPVFLFSSLFAPGGLIPLAWELFPEGFYSYRQNIAYRLQQNCRYEALGEWRYLGSESFEERSGPSRLIDPG